MSEVIWLWWTSVLSLGVFSILWKRNNFYRVVENIVVGGGTAHALITNYTITVGASNYYKNN